MKKISQCLVAPALACASALCGARAVATGSEACSAKAVLMIMLLQSGSSIGVDTQEAWRG